MTLGQALAKAAVVVGVLLGITLVIVGTVVLLVLWLDWFGGVLSIMLMACGLVAFLAFVLWKEDQ